MTTIIGRKTTGGFQRLPEGHQTLHITDVQATPRVNPSVVTMKMLDAQGRGFDKYPQKYDLDSDGGWFAFYCLVKNGLGVDLNEGDEFDVNDLEDAYVVVDVIHKPNPNNPDSPYVNIKATISPGEPFGTESDDAAPSEDWD